MTSDLRDGPDPAPAHRPDGAADGRLDAGSGRQVVPWSGRRRWWAIFGLLFAVSACWALATPLMSGPDESSQAIRAAAVVRGQWAGRPGPALLGRNVFVVVDVPEAYGRADGASVCFVGTSRSGSVGLRPMGRNLPCTSVQGGHRSVEAATLQYRGPPLSYALVGWTSLIWPDDTGMYAMRLVGAAIAAALVASAFASARLLPAPRLASAAVAVGCTPVVLYLAGTVNSSPLETAGAAGTWVGLAALAVTPWGRVDRRLVARVGVAATLFIGSRGLSPGFALVALVAIAPLAGRARLLQLWRRPDLRVAMASAATAGLCAAAWLSWIQSRFPLDGRSGSGIGHALDLAGFHLQQTVSVFGVNDVVLPAWSGLLWAAPTVAVVAAGIARGRGPARVLPVLVALLALGINVSAEGASLPPIGFFWQGRYVLPLLVGVPIVAAALARRDLRARPGALVPLAAGGVALHGWALVAASRHYASRGPELLSLGMAFSDPRWTPPLLPAAGWLVVLAASASLLGALVLRPDALVTPPGPGAAPR